MENYYQLLNVEQSANQAELEIALKKFRRTWSNRAAHPNQDVRHQAEKNLVLSEAMEKVLLSESARQEYDRQLLTAPPPKMEADKDLSGSIDLDAELAESRKLLDYNRFPEALTQLRRLKKAFPENVEVLKLSSFANLSWSRVERAVEDLIDASEISPGDDDIYARLGEVYESNDQLDKAAQEYNRALSLNQNSYYYLAMLGAVLVRLQQYDEGIAKIEMAREAALQKEDTEAEESIREKLAWAYIDRSWRNWIYEASDNSYIPTKLAHIQETEDFLQKARALDVKADYIVRELDINTALCERMKARKFTGSAFGVALLFIFGILFIMSGAIPLAIYMIGGGILYIISAMPPAFTRNKRYLSGAGNRSWLGQWLTDVMRPSANDGCLMMIFSILLGTAVLVCLLPIIIIWNFVANYVRI